MDRTTRTFLADVAIGCVAGLVATKVYGLVQEALYQPMPRDVKRRGGKGRPGPSSQVTADRIAEGFSYALGIQERELAGCAVHWGLGMAWGPIYGLLRRHGGMQPLGAGALTGVALSLIVDEGLAPALGFSAPNREYPALTHVRGLLNHLAYGTAVAITAEALYRLTSTGPTSSEPLNQA